MKRLFFLDFDGVLCDSVDECFVSSWLAYHDEFFVPVPTDTETKRLFDRYRPFIRRGADYLLLQDFIHHRRLIHNQAEFDSAESALGQTVMSSYHSRLYAVRERLLVSHRDYWLGLHKLFPGIDRILNAIVHLDNYYILSTKKAEFIGDILAYYGIAWPISRILYAAEKTKLTIINTLLQGNNCEQALFIDDQVDHLANCTSPLIRCLLAGWGYLDPDTATPLGIERIKLEQLAVELDVGGHQE